MTPSAKTGWRIPAALVALSAVPVAAGVARLLKVAAGADGPADARFLAHPAPIALHVVSVSLFCVLGALQFAPGLRSRRVGWHRRAGRLLVPCGLVAALSGLWMTQAYPDAPNAGIGLYAMRLAVGVWMTACLLLALAAIRRRDIARHGDWMIRGYAIGQGAGTQVLTGLPWAIAFGTPGVGANTALMAAGWLINLAVAEWAIRRGARRSPPPAPLAAQALSTAG